jgi:hypothetical protein
MPLHPIKLPKVAKYLTRVVALHRKLLRAIADPALDSNEVTIDWVAGVWHMMNPDWVATYCKNGQLERIEYIGRAAPRVRDRLYREFCRQNNVRTVLKAGGNFTDLQTVLDGSQELAHQVKALFKRSYELLGHRKDWPGYAFPGKGRVSKQTYKDAFCAEYPTSVVCPYCDGGIGVPQLDHYYCQNDFPLLTCSPHNLIPICPSCNDQVFGKGDQPALDKGPPASTAKWLHPLYGPASGAARVELSGPRRQWIPLLRSPDQDEQERLDNHVALLDQANRPTPQRKLSYRWTNVATSYFDRLVRNVNRPRNKGRTVDAVVTDYLDEEIDCRGQAPSALVHAAVCQAVLARREGYYPEFADFNPPVLI